MQILGISTNTVEDNAAFAAKFEFPFPLLCDVDRKVSVSYSACSAIDDRAKRITYVIGPDGLIAQTYAQVDAAGHARQLLDSLEKIK